MTDNQLEEEFRKLEKELEPIFQQTAWAEEEIETAQREHPESSDRLGRSFLLLKPMFDLMTTEFVFRSHCRELLARVVAGADTTLGTAAECCCALSEVSLRVPLNTAAAGLYARMWKLAGLPETELTDTGVHYEAIEGQAIDDLESWLRNKLRQNWRVLRPA